MLKKYLSINTQLDSSNYDEDKEEYTIQLAPEIHSSESARSIILALERAIIPNLAYTFPYYECMMYFKLDYDLDYRQYVIDTNRAFHNGTELAQYLTTLVTPIATFTFNKDTQCLIITNNSEEILHVVGSPKYYSIPINKNNAITRLGFVYPVYPLLPSSTAEAYIPVRLQRTLCYYIAISDESTTDSYRSADPNSSSSSIIAKIPAQEFGRLSIATFTPAARINIPTTVFSQLKLSVLDDNCQPIDTGAQPIILEFSYFEDR
jgi:hypothetical protein